MIGIEVDLVIEGCYCRQPTSIDENVVVSTLGDCGEVDAVAVVGDVEFVVFWQLVPI